MEDKFRFEPYLVVQKLLVYVRLVTDQHFTMNECALALFSVKTIVTVLELNRFNKFVILCLSLGLFVSV